MTIKNDMKINNEINNNTAIQENNSMPVICNTINFFNIVTS